MDPLKRLTRRPMSEEKKIEKEKLARMVLIGIFAGMSPIGGFEEVQLRRFLRREARRHPFLGLLLRPAVAVEGEDLLARCLTEFQAPRREPGEERDYSLLNVKEYWGIRRIGIRRFSGSVWRKDLETCGFLPQERDLVDGLRHRFEAAIQGDHEEERARSQARYHLDALARWKILSKEDVPGLVERFGDEAAKARRRRDRAHSRLT